jgi:hypothetical protein
MTGGEAVAAALELLGGRHVFGIVSVHNLPIYDAIARRGIITPVVGDARIGLELLLAAVDRVSTAPGTRKRPGRPPPRRVPTPAPGWARTIARSWTPSGAMRRASRSSPGRDNSGLRVGRPAAADPEAPHVHPPPALLDIDLLALSPLRFPGPRPAGGS